MARRGGAAAVGAPQLHLICGSVSAPAAGPRRPRRDARSHTHPRHTHTRATRRVRGLAVRPPRCMPTRLSSLYSSDTFSTQTLKILGSWMYALAYVNCDSFSFPFLVAIASISSDISAVTPPSALTYNNSCAVLTLERSYRDGSQA